MAVYTRQFSFQDGLPADGGHVRYEFDRIADSLNNITNAQVASSAAIAVSKTTLGTYTAWTTYVPGTVNVTVGNGTLSGYYTQIGNTVIATVRLLWGSTTSFGGEANFGLPTAVATISYTAGSWYALDSGTAYRTGTTLVTTTGSPAYMKLFHTGSGSAVNATTPHTWAVNDEIRMSVSYEAA